MMINVTLNRARWNALVARLASWPWEKIIVVFAVCLATASTAYFFYRDSIVAYGDAESHLNIAKRVTDSLTPGMAQLGGIWLPLPHMLMMPLVKWDFLWRTGLAGSIISGISYVVSVLYLHKLTLRLSRSKLAGVAAALIFATNPNILYLQTTPMTELALIVFFLLSSYYFIGFLQNRKDTLSLILAALFGFCASLSRYDGWFLVMIEAGTIFLLYLPQMWTAVKKYFAGEKAPGVFSEVEGKIILFSTVALFGIALWLLWDGLILGDPLYFTHSEFSAKSQQQGWLARGQLPTYHNLPLSVLYYLVTSMANIGILVSFVAIAGLVRYLYVKKFDLKRWLVVLTLSIPFIFNIATLFLGQSVIFIPHLTPPNFDWTIFNVRYGVMMVPFGAFLAGYIFYKSRTAGRLLIVAMFFAQFGLLAVGYSNTLSLEDGLRGLSSAKRPDAERWMRESYDGGLVLLDDFSRQMSIVRSGIPMQNIIYVGNRPYWQESLEEPEKYAKWIIIQERDEIWKKIFNPPEMQGRLYKYFTKVYTSPEILIFRRTENVF